MSVFQEQSTLLYVIAGLLIVLNVISLAIWMRLGERSAPKRELQITSWRDRPVVRREEAPRPKAGGSEGAPAEGDRRAGS